MKEKIETWELGLRRAVLADIFALVFPAKYECKPESEEAVNDLLRRNVGIVLAFYHPTEGDSVRLEIAGTRMFPDLRRKPAVTPMAYHQYTKAINRLVISAMGGEVMPIVTSHTKEKWGGKDVVSEARRREMFNNYLDRSAEILNIGGVVPMTPQARRNHLLDEPPKGLPTKQLLERYKEKYGNLDNVAILCMAPEILEVENLQENNGLLPFKKYIFRGGEPIMAEELVSLAGGLDHVDATVYGMLRDLIPGYSSTVSNSPGLSQ